MTWHDTPIAEGKPVPGYFEFFAFQKDGKTKVFHHFDGEFTTYVVEHPVDRVVTKVLKKKGAAPITAPAQA